MIELTRRQFVMAMAVLPVQRASKSSPRPTRASIPAPRSRANAISTLAASLREELVKSKAGSWPAWTARLAPVREELKKVAAGTREGRNGFVFNRNALAYLTSTNLEAGVEGSKPLEAFVAFDRKMKKERTDFIYVPIPSIEEVYPENYLATPPADLTLQPAMRRFMLALLERDVEVVDLLRPFQAEREGYRLGLKRDDHWNHVQLEIAASVVAERLRRYQFVQAASAQVKRYTTKDGTIENGERGVTAMRQVLTPEGRLYDDVEQSPVLVVGDSNLQIYQYQNENLTHTGQHAGFTAHLARQIGLPVSLVANGGFRLSELNREPEQLEGRKVVIYVGAAWLLGYLPWTSKEDLKTRNCEPEPRIRTAYLQ
jgi:hypothetical protein